MHKAINSLHR